MTYKQALAEADRVGAAKAEGLAHLAQMCWLLSKAHAINPEMVFNGAVTCGITGKQLTKLDINAISDLMFLEY